MMKEKHLEVVIIAVGRVRCCKWKGVVIEGHPTTAERAGRNKKGRTKGRQGDDLRQGEHEAKGMRRRYVTLRFRWSEQSEISETSAKIRFQAQQPNYRYNLLLQLEHQVYNHSDATVGAEQSTTPLAPPTITPAPCTAFLRRGKAIMHLEILQVPSNTSGSLNIADTAVVATAAGPLANRKTGVTPGYQNSTHTPTPSKPLPL
ncbi:hypothetical protein V8E53_008081 [Lactarius tabidus]